jgi:two-component system chemotaxis sensor kinase CheA
MPEHAALEPSAVSTSDLSAFAADAEMVADFITEAREHIAAIEEKMLLIEKDGTDLESVNGVFRGVHTIKGLAGFLELKSIQDIAHEVETLLDHVRSGRLTITPALVDSVFGGIDFIRIEIDRLQRLIAGEEPPPPNSSTGLLLQLRSSGAAAQTETAAGQLPEEESGSEAAAQMASEGETHPDGGIESSRDAGPALESLPQSGADSVSQTGAEPGFHPGFHPGSELTAQSASPAIPVAVHRRREQQRADAAHHQEERSIRVDTSKLDHLMNMVGELVIAQTLVANNPHLLAVQDPRLLSDLSLVNRIAGEVQRATTSMRMVPIGTQFQKTARVVRDLARQMGKQIELCTSGEDTELDKTIAEALSGPLLHMVRNSVDHGIETPEERSRTSKDPVAQIRLAAYHKGAQIVVEVADDGRGMDPQRILAKAVDRGLVQRESELSESAIYELIFEPGFSTADKLTEVSGRGVGLDVVLRHVQQLRGHIDIESEVGAGTTFFLRLPLTLGVIDSLVVGVGGTRYILPLYSVSEIFCPAASQIAHLGRHNIRHAAEVVTLRGEELPVVRLHRRFNIAPRTEELTEGVLLVTEAHGRRFCLFVDEMVGKQEIVIKSLGEIFRELAGLMGCAILSDGRVGLILDVEGLFGAEASLQFQAEGAAA